MRVEEVLQTQEEEDHLAVAIPAAKAADKLCYVCSNVVLTVVQTSTFWQCVVWCLDVNLQ